MSPEPTPRRAIRIVSQCATRDDFIAVFHPYLERDALFVATSSPEEAGARLLFVMTLAGGEAVLRGAGVVVESHRSKSNFYGLRGMKLRFDELDPASQSALRAVEVGPRRHASSPPPAGRSPVEMVECLIFEEPGTESREPLADPGDGAVAEPSDPGNLLPLTADDDVTAVVPQPARPGEEGAASASTVVGPAPNGPRARPGFQVPRPRSDPSIVIRPDGRRVDAGEIDTEQHPELAPAAEAAVPELVPAPPRLPPPDDGSGRLRRGKPTTGGGDGLPVAAGDGGATDDIASLATMKLPAAEPRRAASSPGRFHPESTPPPGYAGGEFTPPPGLPQGPLDPLTGQPPRPLARQPGAPRRPMVPAASITPTEIVSPMALERRAERRRSRSPMASERTDVVRVSYVRTAAVSATLGALLGLGAGYLLWGLDHERPALTAPDGVVPAGEPPEAARDPAVVAPSEPPAALDAGAADSPAPDAAPAPAAAPAPRPAPRRRPR